MSRLLLHKVNASPPARAVMMVGHILGLEIDYKEPNILKKEHQTEEYAAKNPLKKIPILEDGDFILTDSHAIVLYLITKYGKDKKEVLYPSDVQKRAIIHQALYFDTGTLFPTLGIVAGPTIKSNLDGPKPEHLESINDVYRILNCYLSKTKYLALDELTVADICAGATVTSLETFAHIDGDKFPQTKRWIEGLKSEPCFQQVNQQGVDEFGAIMKKLWAINKEKNNKS